MARERSVTLTSLRREVRDLASPAVAKTNQWFFKTGPGQYGEGDHFLGLRVPMLRALAKKYRTLPYADALKLLKSDWHEERLLALILLVNAYDESNERDKDRIHRAYLGNVRYVNNWDLVDSSAPQIVGAHLTAGNVGLLVKLAKSKDLWERRIAIVSTLHFIKHDEFRPTLRISKMLLADNQDLIHKAVGWMLREVGKRDRAVLDSFLADTYRTMPRTALRYAIERHPEKLRKAYLAGAIEG
jgi:3-methyladenine DNA glycosylase AlkD